MKFKTEPIEASDIEEYLGSIDDFAFEMRVFEATAQGNIECDHGGTYDDPVTGAPRQFDIRAKVYRARQCAIGGGDGRYLGNRYEVVNLAVECKSLADFKPLLISRVPRLQSEAFFDFAHSKNSATARFYQLRRRASSLYEVGKPVGKATSQVARHVQLGLTGDDSEAYEKWAQGIASARDLIAESGTLDGRTPQEQILAVTFPVLVVPKDRLWVVDYQPDGTRLSPPRRTDSCELFIGKEYTFDGGEPNPPRYVLSHLHIFTLPGYSSFLGKLQVNDHIWDEIFAQTEVTQL